MRWPEGWGSFARKRGVGGGGAVENYHQVFLKLGRNMPYGAGDDGQRVENVT